MPQAAQESQMAQLVGLDEEFGPASKIPETAAGIDLTSLEGGTSSVDPKLRAKSLYRSFDPLVEGDDNPVTRKHPSVTAGSMPLKERAAMLLAASGGGGGGSSGPQPGAHGGSGGEKLYTEAEKAEAVREAMAQAEEEATIVQMETEELRAQLAQEREQNTQLTAVMEEYSAEITSLMKLKEGARDGESNKIQQLREQKEQVERDLEKTETAFSDLHSKYQKVKQVVENYKMNEATLKDAVEKGQLAVNVAEGRYNKLLAHAEEKIAEANKEIAAVRESNTNKLAALEMKVKAQTRELASLKREVEVKSKDNEELTALCTELVQRLESGGVS